MIKVTVIIRELGKNSIEFWQEFDLPEVPRVGDCISVFSFDTLRPLSMDLIVRKVWWHLVHSGNPETVGKFRDVCVECDTASGPYSSEEWQRRLKIAEQKGVPVENFGIARVVV